MRGFCVKCKTPYNAHRGSKCPPDFVEVMKEWNPPIKRERPSGDPGVDPYTSVLLSDLQREMSHLRKELQELRTRFNDLESGLDYRIYKVQR